VTFDLDIGLLVHLDTVWVMFVDQRHGLKFTVSGGEYCKVVGAVGGWWRWALVSPDAVAPSRIVCVSASVNFPLHHKVQKFSSGTGLPGWSRKKGCKTVVVWCGVWWLVQPQVRACWFI